jgi:hypothetical protein
MPDHSIPIHDRISNLATQFACLKSTPAPVYPWDPSQLDHWACVTRLPSDQLVTVRFVLSVWSPFASWRCGAFELHAALRAWNHWDREVFVLWVHNPWWGSDA